MENLTEIEIEIRFDKPDFDGAIVAAVRESKIRFLDIVGYVGFDLVFTSVVSAYDYKLDQFIHSYKFKMELI